MLRPQPRNLFVTIIGLGNRSAFPMDKQVITTARRKIIDHGEGDAAHLADLEDLLSNLGGYTLEARATAVLEGLGIPLASHRKPLSTLSRPLDTVDMATGEPAVAIRQRSDVCAVPAGAVVGEAMVASVLADAVLEKFGGDSLPETRRNLDAYVASLG